MCKVGIDTPIDIVMMFFHIGITCVILMENHGVIRYCRHFVKRRLSMAVHATWLI